MVESNQKKVLKALVGNFFATSTVEKYLKVEKYRLKKQIVAECERPSMLFEYANNRNRVQRKQQSFKRLALLELENVQNVSSNEDVKRYARMIFGFHSQDCLVRDLAYEGLQAMIDKLELKLLRTLREPAEVKIFLKVAALYSKVKYSAEDDANFAEMLKLV